MYASFVHKVVYLVFAILRFSLNVKIPLPICCIGQPMTAFVVKPTLASFVGTKQRVLYVHWTLEFHPFNPT